MRADKDQRPCVVLIDEAQMLYDMTQRNSRAFWADIKLAMKTTHVKKVVLAAAYGSYSDSSDAPFSYTNTPISVSPDMVVSIFLPKNGDVSLSLSRPEQEELWKNFLSYSQLKLSDAVGDHLANICAGQVRVMQSIYIVYT
jgi:hypothetical protein